MRKRGGALIGLLAVAIVATLAWWLLVVRGASGDERLEAHRRSAPEATGAPASPLPSSSPADAALPLVDSASGGEAAAADSARAGVATLTATLVHDDDETPVPDVEVVVFATITDTKPASTTRTSARTAPDGTLRLDFEHALRIWLVRALPGHGHALIERRLNPELKIARGETQHLLLRARRGAVVRGQVVDGLQKPVPLAGVLAWCEMRYNLESGEGSVPEPDLRAECDSAGRFELGGLGPQLVLMPDVAGLAPVAGVAGPVTEGAVVSDVTLVVGPAAELRGRVVDGAGRPVAQTWVQAGHGLSSPAHAGLDRDPALKLAQLTDEEGRFRLAPLAPAKWQVAVHAQGFQRWSRSLTPDDSELLIQLSTGLSLSGMVYGSDGAPLDGADVLLAGATKDEYGRESTSTRTEDGRFAFSALLPTATATLGVSAAGHAIVVSEPIVVGEEPAAPLVIRLDAERLIAGKIVDEHDAAVAGATVFVRGDRHLVSSRLGDLTWEDWIWARNSSVSSDADGHFRVERLYDGEFELTVEDPREHGLHHTQSLRSGVDDLVIRLDAVALQRAVLTGTVRDGVSGAPLDAFRIWLEPLDPERLHAGTQIPSDAFRDAQGAFRLQGIEPGRWSVHCDAEGYALGAPPEVELLEGEQSVELLLLPPRSLSMRIVDQDGEPVHRAFVGFEDAQGQRIELESQPIGVGTIGMTDKAGELTAHGLPADRISIVLRLSLVPGAAVGRREVRVPVDLRVQPEGVQEFTIERRRGRCLVLTLRETDTAVSATVYDSEIAADAESLKQLREQDALRPSERAITVTVTDADGTLVDTARCAPNPGAPGTWSVSSSVCSTDEPTSWLATALPTGSSRAVITAEGCEPVTLELPAGDGHLRRSVILRPSASQH